MRHHPAVAARRLGRPFTALAAAVLIAGTPLVALAQAAPPASGGAVGAVVPGRLLMAPRAGVSDEVLARVLRDHGAASARRIGNSPLRIVEVPAGQEEAVRARLARHPNVKFAELDRQVRFSGITNDPLLPNEWHIGKIGAPTAWNLSLGGGVTIAILDTGVDPGHPDLAPLLVPGWNFVDNNANASDVHGHGTKVAGTAAGAANNALGIAGVAGGANIMPIRVADPTGSATYSALAQGVVWAADRGAKVANMSFRVADSSSVISAANYMKSKGGLVTSSAGNDGLDTGIPATTSMIVASATDGSDALTSWSSWGNFVTVAAPGAGIYTTTLGGGYGSASGTSFSAPITAGVLALMFSVKPALPNTTIESLLFSTALDLGVAGRDNRYGWGRVDAGAAVQAALDAAATLDTTAPKTAIASPAAGSTVSGIVAVDATASDNVAVTRVDLLVNGAVVASDALGPYGFSWDSSQVPNGSVTLASRAYDAAGNATTSAGVTVTVANAVVADTTPPVVSIDKPTGGPVSGTVAVKVTATDNAGAAGLRQTLSINGKVVASATGGSLSYSWNTRKFAKGSYTITATALDAAGNVGSRSVTVSL